MNHDQDVETHYPHGRGYGHDYMRGGEVLGGYGYAEREEYSKRRGDISETAESSDTPEGGDHIRTGRAPLS